MNRRVALTTAAVVVTVASVAACVHKSEPGVVYRVPAVAATPVVGAAQIPFDPVPDRNVYAAAGPNMISDALRNDRSLIYVPNTMSDDVYVIDPTTYKVIDKFYAGPEPQHIVPSYDMRSLYVTSDRTPGGGIIPIDPTTGKPGKLVNVQDVYNLYSTPDGQYAMVIAEYYQRIDYYDPATWTKVRSVSHTGCVGINHMDYSADLRVALVSCEFGSRMIVIDAETGAELRSFHLDVVSNGMPQDTRLAPDGSVFLVADMHANGVYVFDGQATKQLGFIPTGRGAHGIYFSRDGHLAYVSNRDEGSISVLDLATLTHVAKWQIPNGSPDMGGVSADGTALWLTGRYHGEVYAISTADGHLLARIRVGSGPHGLVVWPQPGRFSLGHTGNIR